jgi:hypothetical protein
VRPAALLRNWPLKLTSLFLAVVLWLLAAGEQPASRLVAAELQVRPPAGRIVARPLAPVTVAVVGPRRELIKLGASRVILTRLLPDTVTADSVTLVLGTADVELPSGVRVTVQDLQPRQVVVRLADGLAPGPAAP